MKQEDSVVASKVKRSVGWYQPISLFIYDVIVHGISNRWIWRVPTQYLIGFYQQHISAQHLEAGVGTGFLLDKITFPTLSPNITLLDLSEHCLKKTAQRIQRYHPRILQHNLLLPLEIEQKFDSIGINYVLHCIPGSLLEKGIIFSHLKKLLKPNGVLFGSTLLSHGVKRNLFSVGLMAWYRKLGIFNNEQDNLNDLRQVLETHFSQVDVQVKGSAAFFVVKM